MSFQKSNWNVHVKNKLHIDLPLKHTSIMYKYSNLFIRDGNSRILDNGLNFISMGYSSCLDRSKYLSLKRAKYVATLKRYSYFTKGHGSNKDTPINYDIIRPSDNLTNKINDNSVVQTVTHAMPTHILPEYAYTSVPKKGSEGDPLTVWSEVDIKRIRKSCKIAKYVLRTLANIISSYSENYNQTNAKPPRYRDMHKSKDLTTNDLNEKAHEIILSTNSYPSALNFDGFPKSISTSINNVAAHGIPDDRPLKPGDIISVDVAVYHDGFHGNCAETFVFGNVCDIQGLHLVSSAKECLFAAIAACAPGAPIQSIGSSVSKFSKRRGVKAIPALCGHGIGTMLHMGCHIYHVRNHLLWAMTPGNVFTVQPHITEGYSGVELWPDDGFTLATSDNSRVAFFEHTVLITDYGIDILTL